MGLDPLHVREGFDGRAHFAQAHHARCFNLHQHVGFAADATAVADFRVFAHALDIILAATILVEEFEEGLDPALTLKTLMVEVDGKPACCVIPSDRQLSMKKVAAAFGGKSAAMMPPPKAEKLTGYKVGGISPFGQRRPVPTAIDATAATAERVWINAGQRGLLLGIAPADALAAIPAIAAPLIA